MRLLIIWILLTIGCNTTHQSSSQEMYEIVEITSINNWHIIYASNAGKTFKIISKKAPSSPESCEIIEAGRKYPFVLFSRKNNAPSINGKEIKPVNDLDISCYTYDQETEICIEPDKGIEDLYHTDNLNGLCYIKF